VAVAEPKTPKSTVVVGVLALLAGLLYLYSWMTDGTIWYAFHYDANLNQVNRTDKPHDCEWFTAPLGNKNCHYEAKVAVTKTGRDKDGKTVRSYDGGKTWAYPVEGFQGWAVINAAPPAIARTESVDIYWEKHAD
jgi:hypothetical protein